MPTPITFRSKITQSLENFTSDTQNTTKNYFTRTGMFAIATGMALFQTKQPEITITTTPVPYYTNSSSSGSGSITTEFAPDTMNMALNYIAPIFAIATGLLIMRNIPAATIPNKVRYALYCLLTLTIAATTAMVFNLLHIQNDDDKGASEIGVSLLSGMMICALLKKGVERVNKEPILDALLANASTATAVALGVSAFQGNILNTMQTLSYGIFTADLSRRLVKSIKDNNLYGLFKNNESSLSHPYVGRALAILGITGILGNNAASTVVNQDVANDAVILVLNFVFGGLVGISGVRPLNTERLNRIRSTVFHNDRPYARYILEQEGIKLGGDNEVISNRDDLLSQIQTNSSINSEFDFTALTTKEVVTYGNLLDCVTLIAQSKPLLGDHS